MTAYSHSGGERSGLNGLSIFIFPFFFFFFICPDAFFMPLKTKHKRSDLELVKTLRISLPWCRFWSNFTQATPYQQTLCAWLLSYGQRHSHNLHLFAWPIIASSAFSPPTDDDQISGAPWLLAFTFIQPPNKIKKRHRMRERTAATTWSRRRYTCSNWSLRFFVALFLSLLVSIGQNYMKFEPPI